MVGVEGATARRLLHRLAVAQAAGRAPSVVAGVVRDGALVWSDGYGDVAGPVVETRYRIGSITKTLTAVLVLRLVEEGEIGLDQPVGSVLGDLGPGASGGGGATVRELLAHHSGMVAEPDGDWWERSEGVAWARLIADNAQNAAAYAPRERFHYSNLGYALLGELVARVRGASWWDCLEREILRPLGMGATGLGPGVGPAASGFSVHPYTGRLTREPATDTAAMAPAGQLWSTVGDLGRYAAFLVAGHPEVLDLAALRAAAVPQVGAEEVGLAGAHGLGFQLLPGGSGLLVGHGGSMPGFLAGCFVDRERSTGAVVLANATTGLRATTLATVLLDELEAAEPSLPPPWRPSAPVPTLIADVLGVWHWGNTAVVFAWEGEEIVVRRQGEVVHRFEVVGERVVGVAGYHAGEQLHLRRAADGVLSHLEASTFVYTRTPYDPSVPIPGGHPD